MTKRFFIAPALAFLAFLLLAGCQPTSSSSPGAPSGAKKAGTTLAKVGSEVITFEDFKDKLDKIPPFYKRRVASKKGKMEYLDRLVVEDLYYQEALARGMDKDRDFVDQLDSIKKSILAGKIKKDLMEAKTEVSADDSKKYYNEHPEEYQSPETVTVGHILFRLKRGGSEDEKKEVQKKAQKAYDELIGKKITFDAAADKYSDDKGSAKKGGKLPPIRKGLKSKEFDDVAFAMSKAGEISKPFEDRRGFNILTFFEKTAAEPKPYDSVEAQIKRKLAQDTQKNSIDKFTEELRKKYPVEIKDAMLIDEPEAAAPAGEAGEAEENEGGPHAGLPLQKPEGNAVANPGAKPGAPAEAKPAAPAEAKPAAPSKDAGGKK